MRILSEFDARVLESMVNADLVTLNEARAKIGLESRPDGDVTRTEHVERIYATYRS
jgi:hypothetical protein